jgi:hypothetical protein
MRRSDVPAGYSGIHKKTIQGNPIEFCIDTRGAEGKRVNIVTAPDANESICIRVLCG